MPSLAAGLGESLVPVIVLTVTAASFSCLPGSLTEHAACAAG